MAGLMTKLFSDFKYSFMLHFVMTMNANRFRDTFPVSLLGVVLCIASDNAAHLAQQLARWSPPHVFQRCVPLKYVTFNGQ